MTRYSKDNHTNNLGTLSLREPIFDAYINNLDHGFILKLLPSCSAPRDSILHPFIRGLYYLDFASLIHIQISAT